ncbi:DUF5107 domain-containing protein [Niabella insulamsoli]|uniref:DUF5107 domain-containing protein n=1 Tax=Niabella insulamsoli TaxID=3144874 RepID=UPI0031FC143C
MVKAWKEQVIIPTYKTGAPDKNPMFLENRVYQGSSGVVYPHAVIDKVYDDKEDKAWTALFLENDYLKVMILPELGGRIQMAYDKTNDYHFIYHNEVIKPALVGLAGPWISGGIEFNWPQHHRPSTFEPIDFLIKENEDGSKTVWVNEYEKMFGTKCALGFTLYEGVAYIELHAKLYNRTSFPQTFLWWANPAVAVDEHYQSVFPPDVHAVFDHGKRDVSSFPIATGTYYKVDYAPGTDISRYTNIPVPTSYMAVNSAFDFVGGYHHQKQAGLMHIANHHISPGKKQWTWGCGDFGKAWDRQLTDNNGPYFEIMCGMFTDNQPDFSWIMPNEAREFKQYFMPYKNIGYVKNASIDAMINVEPLGDSVVVKAYVTRPRRVKVILKMGGSVLMNESQELSPLATFAKTVPLNNSASISILYAAVLDENDQVLVDYKPVTRQGEAIPEPAQPIAAPGDILSNEDLYLAGLHLEQYRHATYNPLDYYEEALRRDASDIRCNNAKGLWYLRRGQFNVAKPYLETAVEKLNKYNPNPQDSEALFNLALCLQYQGDYDEAEQYFYKCTWNAAQQDKAYLQLALIAANRRDWRQVITLSENSILRNYHGLKARHLKAVALRKLNRLPEALKLVAETVEIDAFDFASLFERLQCLRALGEEDQAAATAQQLQQMMRTNTDTYIEMSIQYMQAGLYEEAGELLKLNAAAATDPLSLYYLGYLEFRAGYQEQSAYWFSKAFDYGPDGVFPNRIGDISVLKTAVAVNPYDYKALYYLGNYFYSKRLYDKAKDYWEQSAKINATHATTLRNLGIAYYNKFDKKAEALALFEKAFAADPSDSRVLFELDQLYKRFNKSPEERLEKLRPYTDLINDRDDLYIEYVNLHSLTQQFEAARQLLEARNFHPWEGGEGKTSGQHILIHIGLAKDALERGMPQEAVRLLELATVYPDHLGEGKIYGAQENDIHYWMGVAYHQMGALETAQQYWERAAVGLSEPTPAIFYNDQQPDKIFYQGLALQCLQRSWEAEQRFRNLIGYGEQHVNDEVKMDFFAVSLPDLMIFDDELSLRNRIHCYYLQALGYMGLNEIEKANHYFDLVLELDKAHPGAVMHRPLLKKEV